METDPFTLHATIGRLEQQLRDQCEEVLRLRARAASPFLQAQEAADYLRCPLSRIRKLTMTGALPVHRDGRRVLYRRDELDEFIANGGAVSP